MSTTAKTVSNGMSGLILVSLLCLSATLVMAHEYSSKADEYKDWIMNTAWAINMFRCNTTYLKEYADEQKRVRNYVRDGQTYNCWDDFEELKAYGNDQCCRIGGFYEDFSTADASVKYDAFKDTVDTIVGST